MTDIDPLLRWTFPPPSGPPQPLLVPVARPATAQSARTAARATRPRRRHPATGGRIIAAGLGAATMFGLIAAMGVAQASTTSTPASDASVALEPLPTITPAPTAATTASTPMLPTPIVLQSRPEIQVVTPTAARVAPAPIATTSGSG